MEKKYQQTVRSLVQSIITELDAIAPGSIPAHTTAIKKSLEELKKIIISAEKENRQKVDTLAKKLQLIHQERKEIKESLDEIRTINAMMKVVRNARSPEEILSVLREIAGKILPVKSSDIFILNSRLGSIESFSGSAEKEFTKRVRDFMEEGIIDWIIDERRAVIVEDLEKISEEYPPGRPYPEGAPYGERNEHNYVFIPLMLRDETKGVFALYTTKPKHEFTNQEMELLSSLSELGTAALDQYRLNK